METYSLQLDISKYQRAADLTTKAVRATQWGDFLVFFMNELNAEIDKNPYYLDKKGKNKKLTRYTEPRVGAKIKHLKVKDDLSRIYTLKSSCVQEKDRGGSFLKEFNLYLFLHPKCQPKRN